MALQVVPDVAVLSPRIVADILLEPLAHPGRQLDAGAFVERLEDGDLVAVELVEAPGRSSR